MKRFSKALAVVACAAIMLSSIATTGIMMVSAEPTGNLTVSLGNVTGSPGDVVEVPVTIDTNTGVWGFGFDVLYDDDVLEFVGKDWDGTSTDPEDLGYIEGELSSSFSLLCRHKNDGTAIIQACSVDLQDRSVTGLLCTLLFQIKDGASAGTTSITTYYKHNNMIRNDDTEVATTINSSTVTVHIHNYSVSYAWSSDYGICTATASCSGCDDVISEPVASTSIQNSAPTCTAAGSTTFTATFTNSLFTTQSETVALPAATGHNYSTVSYVWEDDASDCTATATCSVCNYQLVEHGTITSNVTSAANCTTGETVEYTATFVNTSVFSEHSKQNN